MKFDPGGGILWAILGLFCLIAVWIIGRYVMLPILTGGAR
jgi:hypothetical protein